MFKSQLITLFRRLTAAMPPDLRRRFWIVMALTIFVALTEFALAGAVSLLGVVLASPQTIVQSSITQQLLIWMPVLQPATEDPRLLLALLLCLLCCTVLLKTLLLALLTWQQSQYSQAVSMNLGVRLFQSYMRAPYLWHRGQKVSELMTVLGWRANAGLFLFNGLKTLSQLFVVVTLLAVVCCVAPLEGLLVVCLTSISAVAIFRYSRRWVHHFSRQCADAQQTSMKIIHTCLNGVRDVQIYQQEERFISQYISSETRYMQGRSILPVFPPLPSWVLEFVGMLLLLATVLLLQWQNASLAHISATLALLAAVAWRLLPVMNRGVQGLIEMQQDVPHVIPVLHMLQEVEGLPQPSEASQDCPLKKELRLEDTCFRYPDMDKDTDILHHIDLHIARGSMVGFIGPSGAGKSTLINLLTGLYTPTSGKMLLDGKEMDAALRKGWMRGVGYVPQNPFMLNATIAENIAFSQWGKPIDRHRVLECCRMAAMDFLNDMSTGIDAVIGEHGMRLSGGQLQRVSIARALYGQPQLLIFDEATSALDGASELAVQKTITDLYRQMTVVIIAHRLSTVQNCDWIYWIDNGRIHMQGKAETVLPCYESYMHNHNIEVATTC